MFVVGGVLAVMIAGALLVVYVAGGAFKAVYLTEHKLLRRNVPLAQAQKEFQFPLPPNAKNISYGLWSCGIGHEEYVRFEAPPETCLAHVAVVLEAYSPKEKVASQPSLPATSKITAIPGPWTSQEIDISWFDVQNIRNGVTAGSFGSQLPMVWVDTDRGVFYFRLTD